MRVDYQCKMHKYLIHEVLTTDMDRYKIGLEIVCLYVFSFPSHVVILHDAWVVDVPEAETESPDGEAMEGSAGPSSATAST